MECKIRTADDDELNVMVTKFLPDFKVEDRMNVTWRYRFRPADVQRVAGHVTGFSEDAGNSCRSSSSTTGFLKKIVRRKVQNSDYPCFVVSQIPLIHAWALSIHKCQQR
jgi:hypothetical protein